MARAKKVDLTTDRGREKLFLDILDHLYRYNDGERRGIAEEAGVSISCLNQWVYGNTISPQIRTLAGVARALGYDIVLKKREAPKAITKRGRLRSVK